MLPRLYVHYPAIDGGLSMAKGDRRTRRGKIWRGSYGKTRVKDKTYKPRKK